MIVGLIPARSGSSLKDKNIRELGGHPLLAWSVRASVLSNLIDRTVISTDSIEYGKIGDNYGAEVLMRPRELALDKSGDLDYLTHAFKELDCDTIVILRPTTPLRQINIMDSAIAYFKRNYKGATSLRSAHILNESPHKMFTMGKYWSPFLPQGKDSHDLPRQSFPKVFYPNGYVDVTTREIVESGSAYGDKIMPFTTPQVGEIDSESDFDYIEFMIDKYGSDLWDTYKS